MQEYHREKAMLAKPVLQKKKNKINHGNLDVIGSIAPQNGEETTKHQISKLKES